MTAKFYSLVGLSVILAFGTFASLGLSQSNGTLQTPVLGLVYDQTAGELRAILGVPGASRFSEPLELAADISNVIVAPTQGYAVVERRGDSTMGMLQFSGTTAGPVINLPTDIARPSIVTFSPSGAAVAIHSKLEGKTHIIKGLPSAPQLVRNIARNDLPAELMYLALADDEQTLVAGASNAVYLIEDGHAPEWLRGANRLGGLAPVPGTDSVLVAERNDGRVSLLKNIRTVPSSSPLAMGLPDMESEILLQVESGRAVVGGAGSRKLRLIDLKTSQIEVLELTSAATMARRLGVSRSVLLSYKLAEPAWALDLRGSNGALYFVPATAPGEN